LSVAAVIASAKKLQNFKMHFSTQNEKKLDFFRVNDTADFDPPVFSTIQTGPRIKE
jgi:hypothetical protein